MKSFPAGIHQAGNRSLPVRGAWIEMPVYVVSKRKTWSLPVRGAWIEIGIRLYNVRELRGRSP